MSDDTNSPVEGGVHSFGRDEDWVEPSSALLKERIEWFRDLKLGIFFHYGLYSTLGTMESWALSDEDADWSQTDFTWDRIQDCQRDYRAANRAFYPARFNPEDWARTARECGFRYMILTSKHHEGFCLWDTRQTDYRVTGPECPFRDHRKADVFGETVKAFRAEGLGIFAYFSKADWHHPGYWDPQAGEGRPTTRSVNYDVTQHPAKWEEFVRFTHAQVMELVENYGPLDTLWFDAGWVRASRGEDIRMAELMAKARAVTPGLLVADRTVGGEFENFLTPEQTMPGQALTSPWESCITLDRNGWGHRFEHDYLSVRELVHTLVRVVGKGGNLALGVGPQPDGRLAAEAVRRLHGLGAWLEVNGEALYGTRICPPYETGPWVFTRKDRTVYAVRLLSEREEPSEVDWTIPWSGPVLKMGLLGHDEDCPFEETAQGLRVAVPAGIGKGRPEAVSFRIAEGS